MNGLDILSVTGTDLFVAASDANTRQVVRVRLRSGAEVAPTGRPALAVTVGLRGRGVAAEPVRVVLDEPGERTIEVAAALPGTPGAVVPVEAVVTAAGESLARSGAEVTVGETGWTVHLVPHFRFDPVWWNTQAAATSEFARRQWSRSPQLPFQRSAFDLLDAHLDRANHDPDYRFVIAEIDYLKPYRDRFPWRRPLIDRLLAEGRLEVVGGTYNESSTNLISLETTRRALAHGLAYQRDVLGADVRTAWQLDVFGHAPSSPPCSPTPAWTRPCSRAARSTNGARSRPGPSCR